MAININTWGTPAPKREQSTQPQTTEVSAQAATFVAEQEQVVANNKQQQPVIFVTDKDIRVAICCVTGNLIYDEVNSACLVISMPRRAYREACRPREIQIRWWCGESMSLRAEDLKIFESFESSPCNPQREFLLTLLDEGPGAQAIIELNKAQLGID